MQITIYKPSFRDADGITDAINTVIAERGLTSLDKQFTYEEEREFMTSTHKREAIFVAEVDRKIVGCSGFIFILK
jgi:hypothetical protein